MQGHEAHHIAEQGPVDAGAQAERFPDEEDQADKPARPGQQGKAGADDPAQVRGHKSGHRSGLRRDKADTDQERERDEQRARDFRGQPGPGCSACGHVRPPVL